MKIPWLVICSFSFALAQSPNAARATLHFDAVSIRPCNAGDVSAAGSGRGGGKAGIVWSPGRLVAQCQTVETLIREAWLRYGDGQPWPVLMPGRRTPSISDRLLSQPLKAPAAAWMNTDRYTIEATIEATRAVTPSEETTRGPMLQAILEDRFQLKLHREARKIAVYNLTVAPGGPRLQAAADASCITIVPGNPLPRLPGLSQIAAPSSMACGLFVPDTRNDRVDMNGTTIANFCRSLSAVFDRDVIDKTGITGLFDIRLDVHQESRPADSEPGNPPPPSDRSAMLAGVRAAIPKLGLKLEAGNDTGGFIVIDHIERPGEN